MESINQVKRSIEKAKAIVFDLDGTILNSEPLHEKALKVLISSLGVTIELDNDSLVGLPDQDVYQRIDEINQKISIDEFQEKKNKMLIDIIENENIEKYLNSGIINFLNKMKQNNKVLALVTASQKEIVEVILKKAKIADYFQEIIYRQKTFKSKPSCSPYLYCFRILKLKSPSIVVFEDSYFGISSAIESGANVIGVNSFTHNNDRVLSISNFNF